MSTVSLWLDEPHEPLPRVSLDGAADVAVVGGNPPPPKATGPDDLPSARMMAQDAG